MLTTVAILKPVVRCCKPEAEGPKTFKLPKRVARARRVAEGKRMDSLKALHEALVKTGKEEQAFVKDFFKNTRDMWRDDEADAAKDEEEAENDEE
jgi:hypothetical protein